MHWLIGGIAVLGFATFGCASGGLDLMAHRHMFDQSQRSYTQFVRWGDFDRASEFVEPEHRAEFLAETAGFGNVRISEYEIRKLEFSDGMRTATVDVTYQAYDISTLLVRSFDETQEWSRNRMTNVWLLRPRLEQLRSGIASLRD